MNAFSLAVGGCCIGIGLCRIFLRDKKVGILDIGIGITCLILGVLL